MTNSKDSKEARKRSVEHLQRLLTVVVSLAVAQALQRLVFVDTVKNSPDYFDWVMFGSFFVTLVPFFHGANRYLDAAYITLESKAKPAGLVVDFFFLLIESMMFYLLGAFIGSLNTFYWVLIVLLLFDSVWVGVTFLYKEDKPEKKSQQITIRWAVLNVIAACVIIWLITSSSVSPVGQIILLGLATIVRTVLDYVVSLPIYFPVPAPRESD